MIGPKDKEECVKYWKDSEENGTADISDYFRLKFISKSFLDNNERIINRKFELIMKNIGKFENID